MENTGILKKIGLFFLGFIIGIGEISIFSAFFGWLLIILNKNINNLFYTYEKGEEIYYSGRLLGFYDTKIYLYFSGFYIFLSLMLLCFILYKTYKIKNNILLGIGIIFSIIFIIFGVFIGLSQKMG